MIPPIQPKKTRVIKLAERQHIIYIKHLGTEPYNEVKFDCGKTLIVSYSLTFWENFFQNFHRVNKSVLINPLKISNFIEFDVVELTDNSRFRYSRRMFKKYVA